MISRARDIVRRLNCLRPDIEAEDDRILTSLNQFDFLVCVAALAVTSNSRAGGVYYPYFGMISLAEWRAGTPLRTGPGRPSWCYGTPGLARARQLAAIALADPERQVNAEQALAGCLADHRQLF